MIGPDLLSGLRRGVLAQLAVLAAGMSYACAGIFGRRFAGTPPLVTATGQVTASTVLILPVALLVDHPWTLASPDARVWAALLGLAIISTALGYVVYFRILTTAGATNLLLVTLLMPVIALVLGTLVLGERLASRHFAGMALVAAGLAVIDGRSSPPRLTGPGRIHPIGASRRRARALAAFPVDGGGRGKRISGRLRCRRCSAPPPGAGTTPRPGRPRTPRPRRTPR